MALDPKTVLSRARDCIKIEQSALTATARGLDDKFVDVVRAVQTAIEGGHKLIFTGVGKSAHIANKLVGTLNSTGISTSFLDATQALHGDLGMCQEKDLVFLLSNSGQSDEILKLIPGLRRLGLKTVGFTSNATSDLAKNSDFQLLYCVPREACPLLLAPTAAIALGDALAMVLLAERGLTRDDFAKFHPAGNLGRVLLLRVKDIMRSGARLPIVTEKATTQEAILAMTKAKSGSIAIVHPKNGKLTGIFTDGDFRRSALTGEGCLTKPVTDFMTTSPKTVGEDALGVDALRLFQEHKIDDLIVVDTKGKPTGLVDGQDLPKLKIL